MGKWGNIIEDMMAQMPEDLRTVALGVAEIFTNMDIETARKYIHPDFVDHEASEGTLATKFIRLRLTLHRIRIHRLIDHASNLTIPT